MARHRTRHHPSHWLGSKGQREQQRLGISAGACSGRRRIPNMTRNEKGWGNALHVCNARYGSRRARNADPFRQRVCTILMLYHEQFFAPSAYGWERLVGKIDTEVHAKRGREQDRPAPPVLAVRLAETRDYKTAVYHMYNTKKPTPTFRRKNNMHRASDRGI